MTQCMQCFSAWADLDVTDNFETSCSTFIVCAQCVLDWLHFSTGHSMHELHSGHVVSTAELFKAFLRTG